MNEKLNIQDLIDLLAEKHGMSKKNADSFVKEFFQLIEEALENDKYVKVKGLGAFKLIDVGSRESVNVNTGERFEIQGHTKVSFTPEPTLKDIINKPFSHFETVVLNDGTVLEDTPIDNAPVDDMNEDEGGNEQKLEELTTDVVVTEIDTMGVVASESAQQDEDGVCLENPKEILLEQSVDTVEETVARNVEDVEDVEEAEEGADDVSAEPSVMKYFISLVAFVILACAGTVACLYYPDLFDKQSVAAPMEEDVDIEIVSQIGNLVLSDSTIVEDGNVVAKVDTVLEVPVVEHTVKKVVTEQSAVVSAASRNIQSGVTYIPDSTNYTIVGTETTYTIKPGETLTKVALRFYGTKNLYPYIVKHNPDVIKKPDNVPAGTTVKIPKLVKKQ